MGAARDGWIVFFFVELGLLWPVLVADMGSVDTLDWVDKHLAKLMGEP